MPDIPLAIQRLLERSLIDAPDPNPEPLRIIWANGGGGELHNNIALSPEDAAFVLMRWLRDCPILNAGDTITVTAL